MERRSEQLYSFNFYPSVELGGETAVSSLLSDVTLGDTVPTVAEVCARRGTLPEIGRGGDAAFSGDYAGPAQSTAIAGTSVFAGGNTGVAKLALLSALSITKHSGTLNSVRGQTVDDTLP